MRKINNTCLLLCKIQGDLFKNYASFSPCSPFYFIPRFMHSDLAKRFDDTTVLMDASSNESFIDEINEQYGKLTRGNPNKVDKEIMYWTGYVYRYWAFKYEVESSKLVMQVPPRILFDRYNLYHSMDIDYVIERIVEEENILISPGKSIEELLEEYFK